MGAGTVLPLVLEHSRNVIATLSILETTVESVFEMRTALL